MPSDGKMTWKQFQIWCNQRAADGLWGDKECKVCILMLRNIRTLPFWKRKKAWEKIRQTMLEKFILPTNQRIEKFRRKYE